MKTCNELHSTSETLRRIYAARIPGRIEWMFDHGFVWVLVNGNTDGKLLPRTWVDDALSDVRTVVESEPAAQAHARSQMLTCDWLRRGRERTFDAAVAALAAAIAGEFPHIEFARWWHGPQRAPLP
jgi:hypothetical protein